MMLNISDILQRAAVKLAQSDDPEMRRFLQELDAADGKTDGIIHKSATRNRLINEPHPDGRPPSIFEWIQRQCMALFAPETINLNASQPADTSRADLGSLGQIPFLISSDNDTTRQV